MHEVASRVYDRILQAQQRNADRQTHLLAKRKTGGGRKLTAGDLAFLLTRGLGKKNVVKGPFVVEGITGGQVHLRTTDKVPYTRELLDHLMWSKYEEICILVGVRVKG